MISIYSGNVPIAQASTFKTLCKSDIPKKCKFFIWTLIDECINTADKLQKNISKLEPKF